MVRRTSVTSNRRAFFDHPKIEAVVATDNINSSSAAAGNVGQSHMNSANVNVKLITPQNARLEQKWRC